MRAKKRTKVMRLTKGGMVEVFCFTKTMPDGCWRLAQIVCGNGQIYSVQYNPVSSSCENNSMIEKVPRNMIHPLPPVNDKPVKWVPGDLIEVFVHGAWRLGKVKCAAYGHNFFFVLLIRHTRQIAAMVCNLRRRHMWANNKWVLIKKDAVMVFNRSSKELQLIPNKVMIGRSESTVSSIGSCSTIARPYQYPEFWHCDDDAVSMIVPEKKTSLLKKKVKHTC